MVWIIQVGLLRTVTTISCPKFRQPLDVTISHSQNLELLENLTYNSCTLKLLLQHPPFTDPPDWIISKTCNASLIFKYKIKLDFAEPMIPLHLHFFGSKCLDTYADSYLLANLITGCNFSQMTSTMKWLSFCNSEVSSLPSN